MSKVIQAAEQPVVVRNRHGHVSTVIGCVDVGRAELNIVVSGAEVDISLAAVLEDEEHELAATNALVDGQAHTSLWLDDEGLDGLIRLLLQAREVRRLSSADVRGSTGDGGSGTVAA